MHVWHALVARLIERTYRAAAGNICGREGHQALHCPNGTVDWKAKWGEEPFKEDFRGWYGTWDLDLKAFRKAALDWAERRQKQLERERRREKGEFAPEDDHEVVHCVREAENAALSGKRKREQQGQLNKPQDQGAGQWRVYYDNKARFRLLRPFWRLLALLIGDAWYVTGPSVLSPSSQRENSVAAAPGDDARLARLLLPLPSIPCGHCGGNEMALCFLAAPPKPPKEQAT